MNQTLRFKLFDRWYTCDVTDCRILGVTDDPDLDGLGMIVPGGGSQEDLSTVIHELMHGCGMTVRAVHRCDEKGRDTADYIAKVLFRMGWRKQEG